MRATVGVAMALLTACAGTRAPAAAPTKQDLVVAAEAAWAGLEKLDRACARRVRRATAEGNVEEASDLSTECLAAEVPAETARELILDDLRDWQPGASTRVACYAEGFVDGYAEMLAALRGFDYEPGESVLRGRASARWLASLAERRAGRCVP
jgi:hypothetical protein